MTVKAKNQLKLSLVPPAQPDGLPAVSLFSGAGGLDLGLETAVDGTIKFCAWVENEPDCQETLIGNNPRVKRALFSDISKTSPKEIMKATGLDKEETFLIAGGPPCQAFSTAGLRNSIHEN